MLSNKIDPLDVIYVTKFIANHQLGFNSLKSALLSARATNYTKKCKPIPIPTRQNTS